jgi:hypothetical protein
MTVSVEFYQDKDCKYVSGHEANYQAGNLYTFESAKMSGDNQITLVHKVHGELHVNMSDCIVYGECKPYESPGLKVLGVIPEVKEKNERKGLRE